MSIAFGFSLDLFNICDELNINDVLVSTDISAVIMVMPLIQKYLKMIIAYKKIISTRNKSPLVR